MEWTKLLGRGHTGGAGGRGHVAREAGLGELPLTAEPLEQVTHGGGTQEVVDVLDQTISESLRAGSRVPGLAPVGLAHAVEAGQAVLLLPKEVERVGHQLYVSGEDPAIGPPCQDEEEREALLEPDEVGVERADPAQVLPVAPRDVVVRRRDDDVVKHLASLRDEPQDVHGDLVALVGLDGAHAPVEHLVGVPPGGALRELSTEELRGRLDTRIVGVHLSSTCPHLLLARSQEPDRAGGEQIGQDLHGERRVGAQQVALQHPVHRGLNGLGALDLLFRALPALDHLDDGGQDDRRHRGARGEQAALDDPHQRLARGLELPVQRVQAGGLAGHVHPAQQLDVLGDQRVLRVLVEPNNLERDADAVELREQAEHVPLHAREDLALVDRDLDPIPVTGDTGERTVADHESHVLVRHHLAVSVQVHGAHVDHELVRARDRVETRDQTARGGHELPDQDFRRVVRAPVAIALGRVRADLEAQNQALLQGDGALALHDEDVELAQVVVLAVAGADRVDVDEPVAVRNGGYGSGKGAAFAVARTSHEGLLYHQVDRHQQTVF